MREGRESDVAARPMLILPRLEIRHAVTINTPEGIRDCLESLSETSVFLRACFGERGTSVLRVAVVSGTFLGGLTSPARLFGCGFDGIRQRFRNTTVAR